jgi:hypothetical protein
VNILIIILTFLALLCLVGALSAHLTVDRHTMSTYKGIEIRSAARRARQVWLVLAALLAAVVFLLFAIAVWA